MFCMKTRSVLIEIICENSLYQSLYCLTIASLINYKKGWKPQCPSLLRYLFQNMSNALIEQYKNNRYQCAFDDVKWNNPCSDD